MAETASFSVRPSPATRQRAVTSELMRGEARRLPNPDDDDDDEITKVISGEGGEARRARMIVIGTPQISKLDRGHD